MQDVANQERGIVKSIRQQFESNGIVESGGPPVHETVNIKPNLRRAQAFRQNRDNEKPVIVNAASNCSVKDQIRNLESTPLNKVDKPFGILHNGLPNGSIIPETSIIQNAKNKLKKVDSTIYRALKNPLPNGPAPPKPPRTFQHDRMPFSRAKTEPEIKFSHNRKQNHIEPVQPAVPQCAIPLDPSSVPIAISSTPTTPSTTKRTLETLLNCLSSPQYEPIIESRSEFFVRRSLSEDHVYAEPYILKQNTLYHSNVPTVALVSPYCMAPVLKELGDWKGIDMANSLARPLQVSPPLSDEVDSEMSCEEASEAQVQQRQGYVQRVRSTAHDYNANRVKPPVSSAKVFEFLITAGLSYDTERQKHVAFVKDTFPPNTKLPNGIEEFCFPDVNQWGKCKTGPPTCQTYSLILTDEFGRRRFGMCHRVRPEGATTCIPLAYCVVSSCRAPHFYKQLLEVIAEVHGRTEACKHSVLGQLYSQPLPSMGGSINVNIDDAQHSPSRRMCLQRCLESQFESVGQIVKHLRPVPLLSVWGSLLLERRVMLLANTLSVLSSCIDALQSILQPFDWQHILVPIVPPSVGDLWDAPTPFIIGVLKTQSFVTPQFQEGLIVDLDSGQIVHRVGDETSVLPPALWKKMQRSLRQMATPPVSLTLSTGTLGNSVTNLFLEAFISLCGHYEMHVVSQQDGKLFFQKEAFIEAPENKSVCDFLRWFSETAMFNAYIQARLTLGPHRGPFERLIQDKLQNATGSEKKSSKNLAQWFRKLDIG